MELSYCGPWGFSEECCTFPDDAQPDSALLEQKIDEASRLLFAASGRRIGLCTIVARPCLKRCSSGTWVGPMRQGGEWVNIGCGCIAECSCTSLCEVSLPGPVHSVTEVTLDGVAFDAWRVDRVGSGWNLLRTDGGCWPACQDIKASCDEEGSFCVTYERGVEPDSLAMTAMSELACELTKACIPGCECRLPRNIQQKTRQGVTITFDVSKSWLRALPSVAAFLDAWNPNGLQSDPTIWSPDVPRPRVTVQEGTS